MVEVKFRVISEFTLDTWDPEDAYGLARCLADDVEEHLKKDSCVPDNLRVTLEVEKPMWLPVRRDEE